mmetsp:Transcript_48726/g.95563  ORF Transcript_48726/g.95563 Transcript_48726/m.95563 type:complete len:941 (-) Transcript_48726:282-3104(-)
MYKLHNCCRFPRRRFKMYGLGVYLYFRTLNNLGIFFLFFSVMMVPTIYLNTAAADAVGLDDWTTKTTFAAFAHVPANYTHNTIVGEIGTKDISLFIAASDATLVLLLFIMFIWLKHKLKDIEYHFHSKTLTLDIFSIMVTRIPADVTSTELQHFFQEKFGQVVDVAIAYNNTQEMDLAKSRYQLEQQKAAVALRGKAILADSIQKKIAIKDKEIELCQFKNPKKAVAAFVTFEHQESVHAALATYPNSWLSVCCFPRRKKFRGLHRIKVAKPGEPSNIKFKNLKWSMWHKKKRRCLTSLFSVLVLLTSIGIVYGLQALQNAYGKNIDISNCSPTMSQAQVVSNPELTLCYCERLTSEALLDQLNFCSEWVKETALTSGIVSSMAIAIVIINALLRILVTKIARMELYSNLTSEQYSIGWKLFVSSFVNTALIVALVNANLDKYITSASFFKSLFAGKYDDFSPEWYNVVGFSLLLTCLINIVNPHWSHLLHWAVSKCRRSKKPKDTDTQEILNKRFKGQKFHLASLYAQVMNVIFCTLVFCGGMPILIPTCCLTLFLIYWFEKLAFVRVYATPPRFDATLSNFAMSTLPWALLLHLPIAFWMFTSEGTAAHQLSSSIVDKVNQQIDSSSINRGLTAYLTSRFFTWNGFIIVCLWAVLLVYQLFSNTLFRFLPLCSCSCGVIKKVKKYTPFSNERTKDAMSNLALSYRSYHIHHHEDYAAAFKPDGCLEPDEPLAIVLEDKYFMPEYVTQGYYALKKFKLTSTPKKVRPAGVEPTGLVKDYYSSDLETGHFYINSSGSTRDLASMESKPLTQKQQQSIKNSTQDKYTTPEQQQLIQAVRRTVEAPAAIAEHQEGNSEEAQPLLVTRSSVKPEPLALDRPGMRSKLAPLPGMANPSPANASLDRPLPQVPGHALQENAVDPFKSKKPLPAINPEPVQQNGGV